MKKIAKRVIIVMFIICMTLQANIVNFNASTTVGKTSITTVKQNGEQSIKVSWSKVSGASGYTVQYRLNGGKWHSKDSKKQTVVISNLNIDTTYQVRVRAYKNVNGKKEYGKYSVVKKIDIRDYIYLVSEYQPYNSSYYEEYANGKFFFMGGEKQKNSFTLGQEHWGVKKIANFNIQGKYATLSFKVGQIDGIDNRDNFDVNIYSDGILLETISIESGALPQTVNIPLDNTERLTFEVEQNVCTIAGFSDVKLFFR
jgi:hypothetical protein